MGKRGARPPGGDEPPAREPARDGGRRQPRHDGPVPATELLAREGRPIDEGDSPVLGEAVASVRRGMLGVTAALVVIAGGGPLVSEVLLGDDSAAGDGGQRVDTRSESTEEGRDRVEPASASTTTTSTPPAESPSPEPPGEESQRETPRRSSDPGPAGRARTPEPSGSPPDWREEWREYVPDRYQDYAEEGSEYQRRYWGG
ncbi:hypothetical protein H0B56_08120 [Haloechinothrix sp. YIM 98757]|uniref:Uncharacterized protein n=1 Tax=Haloechinothrix aidingensis TaxID=2752311 RepID=A0A837ZZ47_9PSEU|nr:hypothetical protein [Haloechinothrix aidingensis]MBA0125504.1 hypothetical protein [Haloechinothrix aidingensis]